MYAAERQNQIYQLIKANKRGDVNELSKHFGVSKTTIRTDLASLDEQGLLTRTHGGAILREDTPGASLARQSFEESLVDRAYQAEKQLIAKAAMRLIENGDILLIDNGTTALEFARQLATTPFEELTIYSSDLYVLAALEENSHITAHVLPGTIRGGFHYAYGDDTIAALQNAHFSKLFLTTSALDLKNGLTVVQPHLNNLKRAMIQAAKQVILLADSSKIGETRFQKFADLSDIDVLVTDSHIGEAERATLSKLVGELIVCDCN